MKHNEIEYPYISFVSEELITARFPPYAFELFEVGKLAAPYDLHGLTVFSASGPCYFIIKKKYNSYDSSVWEPEQRDDKTPPFERIRDEPVHCIVIHLDTNCTFSLTLPIDSIQQRTILPNGNLLIWIGYDEMDYQTFTDKYNREDDSD